MQTQQQKHIVATKTNSPSLINSGIEKAVPYQVSDVFATKAKQDGTVEKIDRTNGLLIVKYKDGTNDVFDIDPKMNKNSSGGFYVEQTLQLLTDEGKSFKKGDILAKNDDFFKGTKQGDISYVMGKLSKVAINSSANTFEDSSLISSSMSDAMATKVSMKRAISIDKNSNVDFVVKEGQKIETGQPLAIFEPEFDDSSITDLLSKLGDEFEEEIDELSSKVVKSRYSGVVVRVNLYYNVDLEDCSPSVRKLIEDYINKYKRKEAAIKRNLKGNDNRSITVNLPTIEKLNTDKVHGETFDGILLEVFVEYEDNLTIGDKVTRACRLVS